MNSENSKTSKLHALILNINDKIDLQRGVKNIALSNLSIHYTWKNLKKQYNNIKLKISVPKIYLMDRFLYQIFKIISRIFNKTYRNI